MTGLRIAHLSGYDRVVHHGSDNLCSLPYSWFWDHMTKPTAHLGITPAGYPEWDIWPIKDLKWLIDFGFIEKYDWPNQKPDWLGHPVGEVAYETILRGHYDVLPIYGARGGMAGVDAHNMREKFPDRLEYITHVTTEGYAKFLEINGHSDLIAGLYE